MLLSETNPLTSCNPEPTAARGKAQGGQVSPAPCHKQTMQAPGTRGRTWTLTSLFCPEPQPGPEPRPVRHMQAWDGAAVPQRARTPGSGAHGVRGEQQGGCLAQHHADVSGNAGNRAGLLGPVTVLQPLDSVASTQQE